MQITIRQTMVSKGRPLSVNGGIPVFFDSASISNSEVVGQSLGATGYEILGATPKCWVRSRLSRLLTTAKPLRYQRIGKIREFLDVVVRLH